MRAEALPQDAVYHLRVGPAPAALHDLADEKRDGPVLAGPDVPYRTGMLGNHAVHHLSERGFVADLREAAVLHDLGGGPARAQHLLEDLFGEAAAQRPAIEQSEHLREGRGSDSGLLDLLPRGVEVGRYVADEP